MSAAREPWPVASPFTQRRVATRDDLDAFGHVNNVRYIAWALDAAWAHSDALGLSFADYARIGAGCVVWRHEFDYIAPVLEGEAVDIATWIDENDGRVRLVRAFEMRRASDSKPVFRGRTKFVCIDMKTGKPARMPPSFVDAYRPAR